MSMTPQMEAIFSTISAYKASLDQKLLEQENEPREFLEFETFAAVLSGIQSFRRLPGIRGHIGFDAFSRCETEEDAAELREYLGNVFGVHDAESLNIQAHEFFHIFNEYQDFVGDWENQPNFNPDELDSESRTLYFKSRDFAAQFRDLVGLQGFLAWDIGERIMLCRAAHAAGIINDDYYRLCLNAEVHNALSLFNNWAEFAISALCGSVYFMFVSMDRNEEEGLSGFLNINMASVQRLFEENIWALNSWFFVVQKTLAIDPNAIRPLLDEARLNLACVCSERVLCDGYRVSVMIREGAVESIDSGWRFFAGDESEEFLAEPTNFGTVHLNLVCNYSPDIIEYLNAPVGTIMIRDDQGVFRHQSELDAVQTDPVPGGDGDPHAFG
ncbi:MAG: DUF2185 domain-containing protein [Proteobacteria bacterium]|nr:DUF2185 domain-containing protein [Pseudomonadota bacterium]